MRTFVSLCSLSGNLLVFQTLHLSNMILQSTL
nr:MAG TPA: hypothetical protein [Caudoviricetes sp.]